MDKIPSAQTSEAPPFRDLIAEVVHKAGFSLYDIEYFPSKKLLRLYIFDAKTNNAQLSDCVLIDKMLTPYLDTDGVFPPSLTLEVSSPGVFRVLKTKEHFDLALNQWASFVMDKKWNWEKYPLIPKKIKNQKKLRGKILSVREDDLTLEVYESPSKMTKNYQIDVPYASIKRAQMDPDL
jgi:ribosome maturation factor RimP